MARAASVLAEAATSDEAGPLSLIYALPHFGAAEAGAVTAALANIAVDALAGQAAEALFVLPQEANVWGMRDTGGSPDLLPGYRQAGDETARQEMERLWGAPLPSAQGREFVEMTEASKRKSPVRALVVMNDNPLMLAPARARVRKALEALDFLAVIDSLPTDTANLAHAVLPDVSPWGKEGTTTSADRRVLRLHPATAPPGQARQGWRILSDLGSRLAERLKPGEIRIRYQSPGDVMDEMSQVIPLYANSTYRELDSGAQQPLDGLGPRKSERQPAPPMNVAGSNGFLLTATRSLYTSYEGAAVDSPDADKLHREESALVNPADAAALGIAEGDSIVLRNGKAELRIKAHLTPAVAQKTVHVPLYYDGGAVSALFDADNAVASVELAPA